MQQNYFIPQFERLNLKHDAVFQQDGASCYFALRVKQFLKGNFITDGSEEMLPIIRIANDGRHVKT